MIFLILYIFAISVAVMGGIMCALSDWRTMTIPNSLVIVILAAFFVAFGVEFYTEINIFQPLLVHCIAGAIVFFVTLILFLIKVFGGGDAKLMTAYAFWVGLSGLLDFVFYCAVLGAVLGAAALLFKRTKPFKNTTEGSWLHRVQSGESVVPYGLPIVVGAFIAMYTNGYFSLAVIQQFVGQ